MILQDSSLKDVFKNRIVQENNFNSNSELFVLNDQVLKIYNENDKSKKYNLDTIKQVMKRQKYLNKIPELVLPTELITYNNNVVGFSMPFINGECLEDILKDNSLNSDGLYIIFIELLELLNQFEKLPFSFVIGDIHEKNVIITDYLKINIIDCDSFIIKNKKLEIDDEYHIGKYINCHYQKKDLDKLTISCDHFCLLCMILNYLFKNITADTCDPVSFIRDDDQFLLIKNILNRTEDLKSFRLTIDDIDKLFNFKKNLNYEMRDNPELEEQLKRVRKISMELGGM